MKTFAIELQRIKGLTHSNGMVRARVEATVQSVAPRADEGEALSSLDMSVENARVLYLLLKAQLADVDPRKGPSQR